MWQAGDGTAEGSGQGGTGQGRAGRRERKQTQRGEAATEDGHGHGLGRAPWGASKVSHPWRSMAFYARVSTGGCGSMYRLTVVSPQFDGKTLMQQHR